MIIEIIYALFCFLALFSALLVVLSPHPVYSALYLVLTMVSIGGLFVMMNAQLAAAFQIIVYAGAIMVLFLFVIMLLNLGRQQGSSFKLKSVRWWGAALAGAFLVQIAGILANFARSPAALKEPDFMGVSIGDVARLLITDYIYAFEMTSVLLLIAVIGAVVLARKQTVRAVRTRAAEQGQ